MNLHYEAILAYCQETPWAITREKLGVIERLLARKAAGEQIPEQETLAAVGKKRDGRRQKPQGGVGILPLYGVMAQRMNLIMEFSGGTSTDLFGQWLDAMVADDSIEAIVIDVDSPGGSVYGTAELGDKIFEARKKKKVIAVANSIAASAAYYVASQASELVVTPSGQVGSIGVYMMHVDVSEALRQSGQKVTFVATSERKVAGNQYEPLGTVGREEYQGLVDDYYRAFVRAVARGRNTSQAAVRDGFGRGGMVRAEAAVREGMADRVGTLDSVLGRYGLSMTDVFPSASAAHADPEIASRRARLNAHGQRGQLDDEIAKRRRRLGNFHRN